MPKPIGTGAGVGLIEAPEPIVGQDFAHIAGHVEWIRVERGNEGHLLLFFSHNSKPRYLPIKALTEPVLAEVFGVEAPPTLGDLRCPTDGKKVHELLHPEGFSYKRCANTEEEHYFDVPLCPLDQKPMYPRFEENVGRVWICVGKDKHRWTDGGALLAA